jgi:hypothetical protein
MLCSVCQCQSVPELAYSFYMLPWTVQMCKAVHSTWFWALGGLTIGCHIFQQQMVLQNNKNHRQCTPTPMLFSSTSYTTTRTTDSAHQHQCCSVPHPTQQQEPQTVHTNTNAVQFHIPALTDLNYEYMQAHDSCSEKQKTVVTEIINIAGQCHLVMWNPISSYILSSY